VIREARRRLPRRACMAVTHSANNYCLGRNDQALHAAFRFSGFCASGACQS